jgi:integrase
MKQSRTTFLKVAASLIEDASARVTIGTASPTLPRDYRYRLENHCVPFFGKTQIANIDSPKLREFRNALAAKGLKAQSILSVMSFVSMVLKLAEQDGVIQRRPTVPRGGHRDHPRPWLSRPDYNRLLAFLRNVEIGKPPIAVKTHVIDRELRDIVTFTVNSFLRPGDIFKLKHRHVDIIDGVMGPPYLRLNLPPSKNHPNPIITMPIAAKIYTGIKARQAKLNLAMPDDYVFMPGRLSRPYAHRIIGMQFTEILSRLELKADAGGEERTLYSLRHTAIMFRLLDAEDLDLLTLARACRTSVEMIDRFVNRRGRLTPISGISASKNDPLFLRL